MVVVLRKPIARAHKADAQIRRIAGFRNGGEGEVLNWEESV
jgi:hypothetical protein